MHMKPDVAGKSAQIPRMHREFDKFPVGILRVKAQADLTSFLPGGVCNKADPPLSFQAGRRFLEGVDRVLSEGEVVLLFRMIGVLGVSVFVGTYALLFRRVITGDSVAFLAGNTVAAVLVLTSNFAAFHLVSVIAQIVLIAVCLCTMILLFLEDTAEID